MADDINDITNDENEEENGPSELDLLRKRAKTMGISFHANIGVDALRKKIDEKLNESDKSTSETSGENVGEFNTVAGSPNSKIASRRKQVEAEAKKLIRVRITNLNPNKSQLQGEIFTVGNELIGEVKQYIPYGEVTDEGYHVKAIILKQLKAREFNQVKVKADPRRPGHQIVTQRLVKEFAIEELPQLTKEELKELAATQAAAGGV